ncbi:carboxypeptidase C (cathepsin A) [Pseudochelatococcus lubricantis]|uniref:Carboxypeptidase C (Cathepsin A) n=1 Tax=Pseudochelatococcus lubricantis TaxID=1538102 RepID=A0ABX0UYM0_9HYPH|nr:peptidase S10 [Pseudochelatococcus lubricantis]NIJ57374.1 carboxypeptidase C (cathepsin A) [Pseudochelatococcus lubricantis]
MTLRLLSVAALAALVMAAPASAPMAQQPRQQEQRRPPGDDALRLPARVTVSQSAAIGGERRDYQVTAGSIVLRNEAGEPQAEVGFVAYTIERQPAQERPVTFAFNGGPGAASAYLNFGALGPKRLSFGNTGEGPSAPPVLVDNPQTWLDFTDLVFIDPVGTGYSRFVNDSAELKRSLWSVDGDISALANVVRRYLTEHDRMTSPKFLVGESYGGFRVPKLARRLQTHEGVGISGIVMISPVLDFQTQGGGDGAPLAFAARLPSLAALHRELKGEPFTREALAAVEGYARGDYVVDLLRGPRDAAAVARIVDRVTQFTGLDRSFVERRAGRLDIVDIVRELGRGSESVASLYDGLVLGLDPVPYDPSSDLEDPILDAGIASLTSAAVDFLNRTVGWRVDTPYRLLSREVSANWNWGATRSRQPEAVDDLRSALALDPRLGALVVHGATDLVTPYFDSQLALDRLAALGARDAAKGRVALEVLKGGHMFYAHDESRAALREAARRLYAPN